MITELTMGFAIGIVGSVHCIGMCGPIAAMLPVAAQSKPKFILGRFMNQAGRIATYTVFGAMLGMIGRSFVVAGVQQEVSVVIGCLMVITAAAPRIMNRFWSRIPLAQKTVISVKKAFAAAFRKRTLASLFAVGLINGFLPCGLVYMAMAGAATTGSAADGSAFMAGFGAGTLPIMLSVSMGMGMVTEAARRRLSRWAPAFMFLLGVIIILRGLNLGIPMVSPKAPAVQAASQAPPPCCTM
jgi:uncharacterized protein